MGVPCWEGGEVVVPAQPPARRAGSPLRSAQRDRWLLAIPEMVSMIF